MRQRDMQPRAKQGDPAFSVSGSSVDSDVPLVVGISATSFTQSRC